MIAQIVNNVFSRVAEDGAAFSCRLYKKRHKVVLLLSIE